MKLADAHGSGPCELALVWVRIPPSALFVCLKPVVRWLFIFETLNSKQLIQGFQYNDDYKDLIKTV